MESTNSCTEEEQSHTLEWIHSCFANLKGRPEHSKDGNSSRAMASDAAHAPPSSESCQDSLNVALPR